MARNKKNKSSAASSTSTAAANNSSTTRSTSDPAPEDDNWVPPAPTSISMRQWVAREPRGVFWILLSVVGGFLLGFVLGTGYLEHLVYYNSAAHEWPTPWRQQLARQLRMSLTYMRLRYNLLSEKRWHQFRQQTLWLWPLWFKADKGYPLRISNPSDPQVFAILREAIIREEGGYVHPDLGFMVPAPCGAPRGIGMVADSYHRCQVKCLPGLADEKKQVKDERNLAKERNETYPFPSGGTFRQEEVLIRVPLSFQMTRSVAQQTIQPLLPQTLHNTFLQLDDATMLVLLLAHERGVGPYSPWMPYVASLPPVASCGYSEALRPYMLDAAAAMKHEYSVDTEGWPEELLKATKYASRIVESLNKDFGGYLQTPDGISMVENIGWALCQVASRGTAGSDQYGSLRLVPMVDQINHDLVAGGFVELTGQEQIDEGDFVDADEKDAGSFVVRSIRHGRRKPLRKGQELLANYNVPHYSPLDWFVSLGFVPPERMVPWTRVEPVLQRVRESATSDNPLQLLWKEQANVRQNVRSSEL